ncbi:MAG TPA: hypothetical protein VF623_01975, partial [Segetibacter sp.]
MFENKSDKTVEDFLTGKSTYAVELFNHLLEEFEKLENVTLHPVKTMIGIAGKQKRVAWITQFGKSFIHV